MIELILAASIASSTTTMPPSPPVTVPSPKPVYTPPPSPPAESWSEKMWRRYKENRK